MWKTPAMAKERKISICLFGTYPIRVDGQPYHLGISGSTEKLFQYLLVNIGIECRREYLADLFWRDSSPRRQHSAINSAIFRIRQQLQAIKGVDLVSNGPLLALQTAPSVAIDARDFTNIIHSISLVEPISEAMMDLLHQALNTCALPFMDGVDADWVLTERERLFNLQIRGLTILMHWLGQKRCYEDALEVGRSLLAVDPSREAAQCEVMWLYVLNGQRTQALRHYLDFQNWLKREFDIEPMQETSALYEYIRSNLEVKETGFPTGKGDAMAQRHTFNNFLGAIERSRRDLYKTLISLSH